MAVLEIVEVNKKLIERVESMQHIVVGQHR